MFRVGVQQDSHELLRALIDGLGDEHSAFAAAFAGELVSRVVCSECGGVSERGEPFMDLSIPVPHQGGEAQRATPPAVDDAGGGGVKPPRGGSRLSKKERKAAQKAAKLARRAKLRGLPSQGDVDATATADGVLPGSEANEAPPEQHEPAGGGDADSAAPDVDSGAAEATVPPAEDGGEPGALPVPEGGEPPAEPLEPAADCDADSAAPDVPSGAAEAAGPPAEDGGEPDALRLNGGAGPLPKPGTLQAALTALVREEVLDGVNSYACEACFKAQGGDADSGTCLVRATRRMLIRTAPQVLALHLKRFAQQGRKMTKVSRHVPFPVELDLAPCCVEGVAAQYRLVGVVEHSGNKLGGGHYTAYVRRNDRWFNFNDSLVTATSEEAVARAQAYIAFYERAIPIDA